MNKINISKKLLSVVGKTNYKFKLIGEGDRVLVGLSGGKDSLALVHILKYMQRHAPFNFEFGACTVSYGMPGESYEYLHNHCLAHDIQHTIYNTNIFEISNDTIRENSSFCSYFSRMRRGALYTFAQQGGYTKIALGHHFDDAVESFFMNMFYNGSIRTLAPIYKTNRGAHLIRPLIEVRESQLRAFANDNNLYTLGDESCPAMAKNVKKPHARESTKKWLKDMESKHKNLFKMLKASFEHIHDDTLFDPSRWIRDDIDKASSSK